MPANLEKPFDPACCEGATCADGTASTTYCGCDPGLMKNGVIVGHLCERHQAIADVEAERILNDPTP